MEEREEEGGVTRKKMKMKISKSESVNVLKEERVKAMPFLRRTLYNMSVVFLRVIFSLGGNQLTDSSTGQLNPTH